MFDEIMEKFSDSPGQQAVIRLLLERGFSVNDEGGSSPAGSRSPTPASPARWASTAGSSTRRRGAILDDEELTRIFTNISAIPSLMDLAPVLDLTVLTVAVRDAEETGIVATVTDAIADHELTIRQVISEDPEFTDEPVLYVITDEDLPGELINELRAFEFVRRIEIE